MTTEPLALLRELDALGVRLMVDGSSLKADAPKGTITPELAARIRASKAELLAHLTHHALPVLPAALLPLVRAAVGGHLGRYVPLAPGQIVGDLNDFVLTAAALYAVGFNSREQKAALWAARRAWAS